MIRKAVVTGGVVYHHALTRPGQPLGDYEQIDVHRLTEVDLGGYDLLVVLRSVDGETLRARRHQFARFLGRGGVLVVFGEAWTNWFPGCNWEPECDADLLVPVVVDHPLLDGIAGDAIHWHGKGPRWCNHGHLLPPAGAEILVANQRGDAFAYIDRATTNGVILAATNLDLDTHSYHFSEVARGLMHRTLGWAEREADGASERRARAPRKIAGLFSGVHFQRGFYGDTEFGPRFAILPADELGVTDLRDYAALWIPRESNQAALGRHRDRIANYLAGGGTVVCFDEVNQPWLDGLDWALRKVDVETLTLAEHPILDGLTVEQVRWHGHGTFRPPEGAVTLIGEGGGEAVLYVDERSYAPGRLLAGTLDPDCHVGYGNDLPRPLLRGILRWVLAGDREMAASRA